MHLTKQDLVTQVEENIAVISDRQAELRGIAAEKVVGELKTSILEGRDTAMGSFQDVGVTNLHEHDKFLQRIKLQTPVDDGIQISDWEYEQFVERPAFSEVTRSYKVVLV